ncbi:piggyBac transposable element-derived protein 4-like [Euwallacea similis]|uniref:piggyBac transposable element-derived protein 4-like n=1 Tax=Euwallacea similis TaxID=1736056 RepID=UPI00344E2C37
MGSKKLFNVTNSSDVEYFTQLPFQGDEVFNINNEVIDDSDDEENNIIETEILHSDTQSDSDSELDEVNFAGYNFSGKDDTKWGKFVPPTARKRMPHNIIRKLPGPVGPSKGINTVLGSWMHFFSEEIINMIVSCTNLYIQNIQSNYSRERDVMTTSIEIKAFFGLLYLAGLLKSGRQSLEDLWSTDGIGVELFISTMSLRRFKLLYRCCRFDDKSTREERRKIDKLAPIRELFDLFVNKCKACYSVSQNVTVDEKLESFRGKCSFRQYIPSKPNKYGIKIFALVDSKLFYTLNLEVYVRKQPKGRFDLSNSSTDLVLRLAKPIYGTGRNVTEDNWFTNLELIEKLKNQKLSFVGTVRKNKRQIPPIFLNVKERAVYSSMFGFNKTATLVSYVPKKGKNVLLLSSMHFNDKIDQRTRELHKPEMMSYYNATKSGVDTVDQLCAIYNCARNTRRWPMVIFFSLMNIAAINGMVVFVGNKNALANRREYLKTLVHSLTAEYLQRRGQIKSLPIHLQQKLKKYNPVPGNERSAEELDSTRKTCRPCYLECKRRRLTKVKELYSKTLDDLLSKKQSMNNDPINIGEEIVRMMKKACRKTYGNSANSPPSQPYWWNSHIEQVRLDTIRLRRRALRTNRRRIADNTEGNAVWQIYKDARKILTKEIAKKKKTKWRKLCCDLEEDIWGDGYKIAIQFLKPGRNPFELTTERKLEIAKHLFPNGLGFIPPKVFPVMVPPFTDEDLRTAAKKLKNAASPGPDGLTTEAVKFSVESHPEM